MKHHLPLGVGLSLLAGLFYSLQTALIKAQAAHLPPLPVVIFIQSLVCLLLLLPVIFKNGVAPAKAILKTNKIKLHLLRSAFSLSISYLLFYAVTYIPLVNAMLLANTSPLIVPFLAYLFFDQAINHRLWIPILIGYAGVAFVLQPDSHIFNAAALLAFAAAISMASTMLCVRKLTATESTETTTFYFFLFSALASGLLSIGFWVPVTATMLLIMTLVGLLYFLCQYASTIALKYANAQLVSAMFYTNIIHATLLSWFLWHTIPNSSTLVGMALIVAGGILCIRVEHQFNKERSLSVFFEAPLSCPSISPSYDEPT